MSVNSNIPYAPPKLEATAYNCPHCCAYAKQHWGLVARYIGANQVDWINELKMCTCDHCGGYSFWRNRDMIYPLVVPVQPSNPDLPADIKPDYDEAAQIVARSPRGAAALLRLAIQKLCRSLGEAGVNINSDIAALVKKGLPVPIQQALDIVRVVGNNAVHPGQIDLKDDSVTATKLFGLVNIITEVMISQPKHVTELYESILPEPQRDAIKKRDAIILSQPVKEIGS